MRAREFLREYRNLTQGQQQIIKKITMMNPKDDQHAKIIDRIYRLLNTERIGGNITKSVSTPLADETISMERIELAKADLIRMFSNLDSDYASLNKFLKKLEKGGVVNVSALSKPLSNIGNVFNNDRVAITAFKELLSYGVGEKQKGPGEWALAMLSDKIRLAEKEGDLEIDGIGKVELKTATGTAGGRIGRP